MLANGTAFFASAKAGNTKDNKAYYMLKFHDADAEEYFSAFVDDALYQKALKISKGTLCNLEFNFVPGQKFFSLTALDVVK